MFSRVLLCYDGSDAGRRALKRGAELAVLLKARVFVLAIMPIGMADPMIAAAAAGQAFLGNSAEAAEQLLKTSINILTSLGVKAEGYVGYGCPIGQIVNHAKRFAIDLIVLGHYPQPPGGFWWSNNFRSSLAERVKCCIFLAIETNEKSL
jgi:nucleotide-binding universal stress UspA family protein